MTDTTFPTTIQSIQNPVGADLQSNPDHAQIHRQANDTLATLQAKVGINSSTVATSHDYLIDQNSTNIVSLTASLGTTNTNLGTTTTKLNNLNIYNVKDYGALGNGTADDTTAIQNTIDDISTGEAGGGILYFPTGQYIVSSEIAIDGKALTVLGEGRRSSSIKTNNATANIFNVKSSYACSFSGLLIDSSVTKSAGAGISFNGNGGTIHNPFSSVSNCRIANQFLGLNFVAAYGFAVENNYFVNTESMGVFVRNTYNVDTGDSYISDNVFDTDNNTNTYAIAQQSSGGLRIVNNKILHHQFGYEMDVRGDTSNLLINGNSFEGQAGEVIRFVRNTGTATFSNILINNNQVVNAGTANRIIYVPSDGYSDFIINNNLFEGDGNNLGFDAVFASDVIIQGNIFKSIGTAINYGTAVVRAYHGPNKYYNCGSTVINGGGTSNGAYGTTMTE